MASLVETVSPASCRERLAFFLRRTEKVEVELRKSRRWPWKRNDRLRCLAILADRYHKIGVLSLALGDSAGAKDRVESALASLEETLNLLTRFDPGTLGVRIVSSGMLCELGGRCVAVSTALIRAFPDTPERRERAPLDSDVAVTNRRFGVMAFHYWAVGDLETAGKCAKRALQVADSAALYEAFLWSDCILAGVQKNEGAFDGAMQRLVDSVEQWLGQGDPAFGDECVVYTPALALIQLARETGLNARVPISPLLPSLTSSECSPGS